VNKTEEEKRKEKSKQILEDRKKRIKAAMDKYVERQKNKL